MVIEGSVQTIIFRSEESGYTVIDFATESRSVTVVGCMPEIGEGEYLRFEGKWVTNSRYGEQFKAENVSFVAPTDPESIVQYLSGGLFEGVGELTARNIVSKFGAATLDIIEKAINGERFADTQTDSSSFSISSFSRKEKIAANVTIMKGCNNYCSYCIVPYVRGREVSRTPEEIINEIKSLVDNGVKEVCLLGQNVNSYGRNLSEKIDFPDLLSLVNKVNGLERIRFVTSHPKDFSEKMIYAMAENEKVCRYLHLPLQSGSNAVLKAMNRKYTYEEYREKIIKAREVMPDIEFSSDFIVGFPNETDDDFNDTLNAVQEIGYDRIFAFNYSKRPGTKAFDMEDNVPANVKSERLNSLFALQDSLYDKRLPGMEGIKTEVLVTSINNDKEYPYYGLNMYNRKVAFSSNKNLTFGDTASVLIKNAKRNCMYGIEV